MTAPATRTATKAKAAASDRAPAKISISYRFPCVSGGVSGDHLLRAHVGLKGLGGKFRIAERLRELADVIANTEDGRESDHGDVTEIFILTRRGGCR